MKTFLLSVAVATLALSLSEVDWLVKHKHASYASKNGRTALRMDIEQVENILNEQREMNRRWR